MFSSWEQVFVVRGKENKQKQSDSEICFVVNTHTFLPVALWYPWLVCVHINVFANVIPSGCPVSSL